MAADDVWAMKGVGSTDTVRRWNQQRRCAMADMGEPRAGMDPTLPYYSTNPTDPDVHHLFSDCPSGQQIPPANREEGTNGRPLCDQCRDMSG